MNDNSKSEGAGASGRVRGTVGVPFPTWPAALDADDSLTPGLRKVYRRTLGDFLRFCRDRRTGATVALAREFVDLTNLERASPPGRRQEWKEAFNWFFHHGRERRSRA